MVYKVAQKYKRNLVKMFNFYNLGNFSILHGRVFVMYLIVCVLKSHFISYCNYRLLISFFLHNIGGLVNTFF